MYKKYQKLVIGILFVALLSFAPALTHSARAVDVLSGPCGSGGSGTPAVCKDDSSGSSTNPIFGPSGILTIAIKLISLFIGVIAIIVIVISGLRFVFSNGDSNAAAGARTAIIYSVVGLIVAALAQVIVAFVLNNVN
jgi:hypothetical protein